ncbi:adenine phosphoribosyltransferase [candidate division KSB1 bacterium]|nr:adenine phosphoribosyltransferase [candidate division KSB1 bacterium]
MNDLKSLIRTIPDFPKKGIQFKDITTLIKDPQGLRQAVAQMQERFADETIDCVIGIESRGFIFASILAYEWGVGMVPVRKPGKLPAKTLSESFTLEYGMDSLEIHSDALEPNSRVLIVDDLLATGGTVLATIRLVERLQARVAGCCFLIELDFLKGRNHLVDYRVESLIHYAAEA